jgi:hypothetical protein
MRLLLCKGRQIHGLVNRGDRDMDLDIDFNKDTHIDC